MEKNKFLQQRKMYLLFLFMSNKPNMYTLNLIKNKNKKTSRCCFCSLTQVSLCFCTTLRLQNFMLAQSVWHYPSTYLRLILLGVIRGVNSVPAHTDQEQGYNPEPVRLIDWTFIGPTDTQYSLNKHHQKHQKDPLKYQLLGLNCRRAYLHFMTTD